MKKFLQNGFAGYLGFINKHLYFTLAIIVAITAVSIYFAAHLGIKSDLKELLPENYRSVQELNKMIDRVGGVGSLIITAESPSFEANKQFMDALASKLDELPEGTIRYVDYKSDEVKSFYEKYFLYYLSTTDLNKLYDSVQRRIDYEKVRHSPLFIDLTDEDPLLSEINDIKDRNQKNYSSPVQTVENYYGGEWGRMLIMIVRPYGATLTVDNARKLIGTVQGIVSGLDPKTFDYRLKIGYCGDVMSTVEEYDTLKKDIVSTALLCISLVAAAIVIFFLRLRIVVLLGSTLIIAVAWTFAVTYFLIGYLNSQTAFLGSIIVGTGINYGIIVIARYVEERRKNKAHMIAMKEAVFHTASSTFLAAATTALSFAVLLIAKIKGLSQFGVIGAVGVMLCWVATMLVLPALTLVTERVRDMIKAHDHVKRRSAVFTVFTHWIIDSPLRIVTATVLISIVSIIFVIKFIPNSIEYDFTKLRNETSVSSGTEALEKRVSTLFKHSMTPAVVLLDKMEDAPLVCDAVDRQNMALPESERRVGSCYSIYNLLPKEQRPKQEILQKFRTLLSDKDELIGKLDPELQDKINEIRRSLSTKILTLADIPYSLKKHFEDLKKNQGAVVFINPRPGMLLSDGRNLMQFANTIREIKLSDGRIFYPAGASLIFADFVDTVRKEGPFLTLMSFVLVLVFTMLIIRTWQTSWVVTLSLIAGVIAMLGSMALFGIKLNFFNFIALPITFGIAVDYSINIALRLVKDKLRDIPHGLRHTGAAVVLCSATTIIGYAVLIAANNQALSSFGTIAIIGEVTCITAAVFLTPALLILFAKKHVSKKAMKFPAEPIEVGDVE